MRKNTIERKGKWRENSNEGRSNVDLLFWERNQDCPLWAFEGCLYKNKHLVLIKGHRG